MKKIIILFIILLLIFFINCRNDKTVKNITQEIIIEPHYEEIITEKKFETEEIPMTDFDIATEISDGDDIILFGRVPATDVRQMYEQHKPFILYLSEQLNKPVDLKFYPNYSALIEAVANEEIDFAWFGPVSYVLAEERIKDLPVNLYPLVKPQRHGSPSLECEIIVRKDSNFKDISDLEGKKIAFTDPKSSAGFVLPIAVIEAADVNISPIKESNYLRHYGNVIKSVYLGKFDAGGMYEGGFYHNTLSEKEREEIMILTKSEPVPREPICWVGRGVSATELKKLRNIFLNIPLDSFEELKKAESLDKFHPADAEEYELLINLVRKVAEKYEEISE
jgi:phosphonate transport system substrate-binding protein